MIWLIALGMTGYIIFFQRKEPKVTWAWILLLLAMPLLGILLYFFTGQEIPKQGRYKNGGLVGGITKDNQVRIFTVGDEKFRALVKDIAEARNYIYLQYYIIKNDILFSQILELLAKKVQEGVEVRILYDSFGCRSVRAGFWKEVSKKGIQVKKFRVPFFQKVFLRFNYRNHRKLVIIDDHIGYVGGYNIGKEYVGLEPRFGSWRDTHIRMEGSGVVSLRSIFLKDWSDVQPEMEQQGGKNGTIVQVVASGPDSTAAHIRNVYLRLINKAEGCILIQTPYFIPDEPILTALKLALLSGKKVKIMIPCKPDHLFVYWATYSYVGELVQMGAEGYIYQEGFLHAKGIIIDDKAYCYGTANMDIRSFSLNYEVNVIIYGKSETEKMLRIFEEDMEQCKRLTLDAYCSRNLKVRVKEQLCRLLSPLL